MRSPLHLHARALMLGAVALAALTGGVLPVAAQPIEAAKAPVSALPDTSVGKRVAAYIAAFNSGQDQAMRAFFTENLAPAALERGSAEQRVARTRALQQDLRGLELRRVLDASESAVTVLLRSLAGDWVEFAFQFELASPHRLLGIRVARKIRSWLAPSAK